MKDVLKIVLGFAISAICFACSADVRTDLLAALKMRSNMIYAEGDNLQAIVNMKLNKFIANSPEYHADYDLYYVVRKSFQILGGDLIAINHNFGGGRGCCAKNGLNLILSMRNGSNMSQLQTFSKENVCNVESFANALFPEEFKEFVASKNLSNVVVLECADYGRDAKRVEYITKQQAKAQFAKKFDLNKAKIVSTEEEKRTNNVRTILLCIANSLIDEVFKDGVTKIESDSLEFKMKQVEADKSEALQLSVLNCSSSTVAAIDIDDFRLDFRSLSGKQVKVSAYGYYVMNSFMLRRNSSDMSPIEVNISKVSRDQRKEILQRCSDIKTGCKVNVFGIAGTSNFQNAIVALGVEW